MCMLSIYAIIKMVFRENLFFGSPEKLLKCSCYKNKAAIWYWMKSTYKNQKLQHYNSNPENVFNLKISTVLNDFLETNTVFLIFFIQSFDILIEESLNFFLSPFAFCMHSNNDVQTYCGQNHSASSIVVK
jgi:hypothetical protein